MPTLRELIQQLNTAPPGPEAEEPDAEVDVWQWVRADWQPPFEPPRSMPPAGKVTLEWLWKVLWRDAIWQPDAAELARAAAAWDEQFPQSHEAMARQADPNWLPELLRCHRQHASWWAWSRIKQLLDADIEGGWHEVDQRRIAWLRRHQDAIRPVVEAARAAHVRCYGAG